MSETNALDAAWALQEALYARLVSTTDLQALIGDPARLHDHVPTEPVYPYVTFADQRVLDLPALPGGAEHDIRFHVWSKYGGRKEVRSIISAIHGALQQASIGLDGFTLVNLRFVFADCWYQSQSDLWQGVMRFRAVTQPTPST